MKTKVIILITMLALGLLASSCSDVLCPAYSSIPKHHRR